MKNPLFDHTLPIEQRIEYLLKELTIDEKIELLPTKQPEVERLGIKAYTMTGEAAHGLLVRKNHDQWPMGISTIFPQPIGLSCTWDKDLLYRIGDIIGTEARIWYEKDEHDQFLTLWFPTIDMERDPRWGRNEEGYGEDPHLAGKLSAALIRGVQGDHPYYLKAACSPKHFYGNNMEKDRGSTSTNVSERLKHEYYLRSFKYAFTEGKAHSVMMAYNEINGMPCLINPENVELIREKWGCDGYFVSDGDDLPQMVTMHHYCETHADGIALAIKAGVDCFPVQKNEYVTEPAHEALEKGLLTEKDIDRAVGTTFRTRIRLGHFDEKGVNPYDAIKEERLCCKEHSEVALEACRKAVVLLKNDGILPLSPESTGKVLVLGDLAVKNMADWYSGKPPVAVSPVDAIKEVLPKKKVDTISLHDLCVIYNSDAGAWLRVDDEGNVHFDADEDTRTVFEEIDWGFDSVSYRHDKTKKYLCLTPDMELSCTSDEVWGWFTMELFLRNEHTGKFLPHSHLLLGKFDDEEKEQIDDMMKKLSVETITNAFAPAVHAAKKSDTVIITLGNHPLINGRESFDRPALEFPRRWKMLIDSIYEVNKNIVLMLVAGYPYTFPREEKLARAVLYTSHGEQYVGQALSDVLFGEYNPAGRLSQTWYLSEIDLPPMDDYDIINSPRTYMYFDKSVLYPFGHGLSYTLFDYSDMAAAPCDSEDGSNDGAYEVSCTVKNIGGIVGDEVVQLYAMLNGITDVMTPNKTLCGFERIYLEAGQSRKVTFVVPAEELRLYDEDKAEFSITPENVTFKIGSSSTNIRCELTV